MGMVYKIKAWIIDKEDTADFYIIGDNFWGALESADTYLDKELGEDNWDILTFKAKPNINVVNYLNDEMPEHFTGDCSCPFDTFETSVPDKQIIINCPSCDDIIKVADNNWITIRCPHCWDEIKRENVYKDETGKWFARKEKIEKEE